MIKNTFLSFIISALNSSMFRYQKCLKHCLVTINISPSTETRNDSATAAESAYNKLGSEIEIRDNITNFVLKQLKFDENKLKNLTTVASRPLFSVSEIWLPEFLHNAFVPFPNCHT